MTCENCSITVSFHILVLLKTSESPKICMPQRKNYLQRKKTLKNSAVISSQVVSPCCVFSVGQFCFLGFTAQSNIESTDTKIDSKHHKVTAAALHLNKSAQPFLQQFQKNII